MLVIVLVWTCEKVRENTRYETFYMQEQLVEQSGSHDTALAEPLHTNPSDQNAVGCSNLPCMAPSLPTWRLAAGS